MPTIADVVGNTFSYSDLLGKALDDRQRNNQIYANLIAHGREREANQFMPTSGANFNYLGVDEEGAPVYQRQIQRGIGYAGVNSQQALEAERNAHKRLTELQKKQAAVRPLVMPQYTLQPLPNVSALPLFAPPAAQPYPNILYNTLSRR